MFRIIRDRVQRLSKFRRWFLGLVQKFKAQAFNYWRKLKKFVQAKLQLLRQLSLKCVKKVKTSARRLFLQVLAMLEWLHDTTGIPTIIFLILMELVFKWRKTIYADITLFLFINRETSLVKKIVAPVSKGSKTILYFVENKGLPFIREFFSSYIFSTDLYQFLIKTYKEYIVPQSIYVYGTIKKIYKLYIKRCLDQCYESLSKFYDKNLKSEVTDIYIATMEYKLTFTREVGLFYHEKINAVKENERKGRLERKVRRIFLRRKSQRIINSFFYILSHPRGSINKYYTLLLGIIIKMNKYRVLLLEIIASKFSKLKLSLEKVLIFISTASGIELAGAVGILILRIIAFPAFVLDLSISLIIKVYHYIRQLFDNLIAFLLQPLYLITSELSDFIDVLGTSGGGPLAIFIYIVFFGYPPLAAFGTYLERLRLQDLGFYTTYCSEETIEFIGDIPVLWRIFLQFPTKIIRDIRFMHDFCPNWSRRVYDFLFWGFYIETLAHLRNRILMNQKKKPWPGVIGRYLATIPFIYDTLSIMRFEGTTMTALTIIRTFSPWTFKLDYHEVAIFLEILRSKFWALEYILRIPIVNQAVGLFLLFGVARHQTWSYFIQYNIMQAIFVTNIFALLPSFHDEIYARFIDYPSGYWLFENRKAHLKVNAFLICTTLLGYHIHFPFIHENIIVWIGPEFQDRRKFKKEEKLTLPVIIKELLLAFITLIVFWLVKVALYGYS